VVAEWGYTDNVPQERRDELAAPGSYSNIVRLVVADAQVVRARAQPGSDRGLTDCVQPIFTLELARYGDAFFNGPFGYRAQYFMSPGLGLAANFALLAALAPKLLGAVDVSAVPGLAKIDICASLAAASAKIWIAEIPSLLLSPTRDLAVARWVSEAERGVELAGWGLCAPAASKFDVKGALMDPYGNEVVPSRKVRRHFDIHHYGFS
jgi:hypothetical protein